ncbi:hypothetical protein CLOSTMETH_00071 [[Clostridium] methylpentosum DSM 5476]|uniref:Uncharacterized protein n=1 Tax=[Clostridium] methylpentosum DSM 5476 TaxID=537013 RepID=C0E899_9FIRM|nr:hypothetical protein CLOSTMETH_00071 [[Clostridium] methylpentosum DSM 5476]
MGSYGARSPPANFPALLDISHILFREMQNNPCVRGCFVKGLLCDAPALRKARDA